VSKKERCIPVESSKVLLISNNRCVTPYPVFPLGIAQAAAFLENFGFIVEIADMLDPTCGLLTVIKIFKPDFIGISQRNIDDITIQNPHLFTDDLISLVKKIKSISRAPVVLGGSGFSLFPKELLEKSGADFGIIGEAEPAFLHLLTALSKKTDYTQIQGLVYRGENALIVNARKPHSMSAVRGPKLPAGLAGFYIKNSSMLSVQTHRGCGFTCCYCTYPLIEGKRVLYKPPGEIGEELHRIKKAGGAYFFIVDSVFNTSNNRVREICEEIIRRDLKLSWGCFLRPQGLSADLMDLMSRAGLKHIEFGSDSFCDSVLEAYGKDFRFEDIYRSSEFSRKARVHYAHFLIMGGPSETEETMRASFANSLKLQKTVHFPFVGMRIYPGTPLFSRAVAEGVIKSDEELLTPRFYLSPHISRARVFALLKRWSARQRNWIVGELPPALIKVTQGLRAKGVTGPLWEFLAR
jgi:radical SAM superfamily enzyme YgiQ (UPF0313 family)